MTLLREVSPVENIAKTHTVWMCLTCKHTWAIKGPPGLCPNCGDKLEVA